MRCVRVRVCCVPLQQLWETVFNDEIFKIIYQTWLWVWRHWHLWNVIGCRRSVTWSDIWCLEDTWMGVAYYLRGLNLHQTWKATDSSGCHGKMDHPIYVSIKCKLKMGVAHNSGADSSMRHGAWLQWAHNGRGGAVRVSKRLWPAIKQCGRGWCHMQQINGSYWEPTKLGITTRRSCLR